jgi:cytochrome c-type biogenesis protein CcmH/NrfF
MGAGRIFAFGSCRSLGRSVGLAAVAGLILTLAVLPSAAVEPDEVLKDPQLEARARHISEGLRCLFCHNLSIDYSAAPLAKYLRLLVRERLDAATPTRRSKTSSWRATASSCC